MDIQQFLNSVASLGWQGTSLWFVLLGQIILWVGLLRLHFRINRESPNWEECVGKIRSAFLRKINGEEEIEELKIHRYAPSVDRLIELNFREQSLEISSRYLLLKWKIKECIRPYWITWGYLVIGFGVVVWFIYGLQKDIPFEKIARTPVDPRLLWVWLGAAMLEAWRLVGLEGNLERVNRSLLFPRILE